MNLKKIEDLNFYDLLGLETPADPADVRKAYLQSVATYQPGSLASYGLVREEERRVILRKIEEAYQTLIDPEKREAYDERLRARGELSSLAPFRRSTDKVEIQDAAPRKDLRSFVRRLFGRDRRNDGENIPGDAERKPPNLIRGDLLRGVRLTRGISLDDVAAATKINVASLQALEEENYEALLEGLDYADLLRSYARYLGLDIRTPER